MKIIDQQTKQIIRYKQDYNIDLGDIHPVLKRVYLNRKITNKSEVEYELKDLIPFLQLTNINAAAELICTAIKQQQAIVIIGDFDADGATSSALAVSALKNFGAINVNYLVPNRFSFGYGLTKEIVDVAAEKKPDLIITVDNGIANFDGVDRAKQLGIKVLITDHHLPAETLPAADCIVNPNLVGDKFPSKNLAGVGVIFYVMLAVRSRLRELNWFIENKIKEPNMANYLDLVALGTVADVVKLDRNNRVLVDQGIRRIQAGYTRAGIKALSSVANRELQQLTASDLGFAIGPRLNAAGRLDDMALGIQCLLTDDLQKGLSIAQQLDQLNKERRNIETDMRDQAFKALDKLHLEDDKAPLGVCLFDESWHQGVIGIVAARVKDKLHRPVIAFARSDEKEIKGSARSIAGVHIRDVLALIDSQHPKLIKKFGGHAMAAGLTINHHNLKKFSAVFSNIIEKIVNEDILQERIYSDGELQEEYFNLEVAETLRNASPWGQGFPEPLFDGQFYIVDQRLVGEKHLKMLLKPLNSEQIFDAIAFNINNQQWPNHRAEKIHAVYRLDINYFRGARTLQLMVEHFLLV